MTGRRDHVYFSTRHLLLPNLLSKMVVVIFAFVFYLQNAVGHTVA